VQTVYSRVGRVCKKDGGGPHTFRNKWTTFLKTRLNCSVPGVYPFYFDEIQSVTQVVGGGGADRIFGVFNTPENSVTASAVCSFSLADIRASFEADFKVQADANANWLPVTAAAFDRRPGACSKDSTDLPEDHLNFIKENVLMDTAVPSTIRLPHYVRTSPQERLTTIAVDAGVATTTTGQEDGSGRTIRADVLFVGTSRGRVLKLASLYVDGLGHQTNLIEELQIFPYHVAVNNILVVRTEEGMNSTDEEQGSSKKAAAVGKIVVLSDHEVKSVRLQRCASLNVQSCAECVGLQDPYCAWNLQSQRCEEHLPRLRGSKQLDASSLLQSLFSGQHSGCPSGSRQG
jgi:semaphorin 6